MVQILTFIAAMQDRLERRDEQGVTAAEYGLILGLIAVVIIGAVALLGGNINDLFSRAGNAM